MVVGGVDRYRVRLDAGQAPDPLAHRRCEVGADEDEVGGDDRRRPLSVVEHERLCEEGLVRPVRERGAGGPAADRQPERGRDVDPRDPGRDAHTSSERSILPCVRRSGSPCSRRACPRPWRGAAPDRRPGASRTTAGRCRAAAAVHVDDDVGAGDQEAAEEVGQLLVGRAGGGPREGAIEVRARRPEAGGGARGLRRGARDDDQLPAHVLGVGSAGEVERGHLALGLVAVHAAEDDRGRAVAVLDRDHRDEEVRPAGRVRRAGKLEPADVRAGGVQVEGAVNGRRVVHPSPADCKQCGPSSTIAAVAEPGRRATAVPPPHPRPVEIPRPIVDNMVIVDNRGCE